MSKCLLVHPYSNAECLFANRLISVVLTHGTSSVCVHLTCYYKDVDTHDSRRNRKYTDALAIRKSYPNIRDTFLCVLRFSRDNNGTIWSAFDIFFKLSIHPFDYWLPYSQLASFSCENPTLSRHITVLTIDRWNAESVSPRKVRLHIQQWHNDRVIINQSIIIDINKRKHISMHSFVVVVDRWPIVTFSSIKHFISAADYNLKRPN